MQKTLTIFLLFTISLLAYSDFDLDGVDDTIDRCPNTSMTELVDIHGCTIKNPESEHHFDVIAGASYSQISPVQEKTDTFTTSIQADYYYKNFSLQASTAYFNSESDITSDSGQTDTFIGAYYQINPLKSLSLRLGGGLLLPTYDADNNNMDYTASASLSYLLSSINLFGSYSYTVINDDDVTDIVYYQNTNAFNAGIGIYPSSRLYTSLSYNQSDSIYSKVLDSTTLMFKSIDPLQSVSAYLFYTIDEHWFSTVSYAYGLSDSASDHHIGVRLGYYF